MSWKKIGASLNTAGSKVGRAVAGSWTWIRKCPPDWLGDVGRTAVNLAVVIIGFEVISRIVAATGHPLALAHYGIVGMAAAISTIATALLLLSDRPAPERQRGGRRQFRDPGRFWLICFALVAGVAVLATILARLPDKIDLPWVAAPAAQAESCIKAAVQPKAGCS